MVCVGAAGGPAAPESSPQAIEHYSQHMVDAIDLKENGFVTLPVRDVLQQATLPALRWVASL